MKVMLACSPGGHLDELEPLAAAFPGDELVWLTLPGPRTEALEERGERVLLLPPYGRGPVTQARLWRAGFAAVRAERPDIVVTTGAGPAVPACVAGRARGAKVLFVESSARIHEKSTAGRLLAPLAHATFVQWPEQQRVYKGATLCRPLVWESVGADAPAGPGEGTFVTVGTHTAPFTRLLDMAADAAARGVLPAPVVMQSGAAGPHPAPGAQVRPYLPPDELDALTRGSRVVVCHGGVGSIFGALRAGRRPLVLPRVPPEHFDDHQREIVRKLTGLGLCVELSDRIDPEHVAAALEPLAPALGEAWGPSAVDAVREAAR